MIKCSECGYSKYLTGLKGYSCRHPQSKTILFKGSTKPHDCPLTGGKKYTQHGNSMKLAIRGVGYNGRHLYEPT